LKNESENNWKDTLKRIFEIHGPFKYKFAVVVLLILISNSFFVAIPFLIGKIVTNLNEGSSGVQLITLTGCIAACYISNVLIERFRWHWEVKHLDLTVPDYISKKTISHLQTLSVGQHRNTHSLITMSKVSGGESALKNFFAMLFYNILPMIVNIVSAVIATFIFYPSVGVVILVFGLVVAIHGVKLAKVFSKPIDKLSEFRKKVVSKSGGEVIRHMDSLKIANEDDRHKNRHMRHRKHRKTMFQSVFSTMGKQFAVGQILSVLGRVFAIGLTVYMSYIGRYEVGSIVAILSWSNQSLGMLQNTSRMTRMLTEHWIDIVQYFRIMDTETDMEIVDNPIVIDSIEGKVTFDSVCFSYPGSDEETLTGASFEISPGQKVGVVGHSGAGKSTLVSILQMAYKPSLGSVRIDGIDLRNVDHKSYLSCIGVIEQSSLILAQSIRDNLLFGLSEDRRKNVTDKDLEQVLLKLKLDDLIPRLNKNAGEIGSKLSGGQKQRIAIARILLKRPDMLIVDEATSAVDAETERIVYKALDEVSPGATRIFIAHRISTVQDADLILVMDKGMIADKGTHQELFDRCDIYQNLVRNLMLSI